jgi:hypothetical protein
MIEDELLKLMFKAGSIDALQRIYEKCRGRLLTLAMALLNDAHAAQDAPYDVFVTFAQATAAKFTRNHPFFCMDCTHRSS